MYNRECLYRIYNAWGLRPPPPNQGQNKSMDKSDQNLDALAKVLDDLECTRISVLNIQSAIESEIDDLKDLIKQFGGGGINLVDIKSHAEKQ